MSFSCLPLPWQAYQKGCGSEAEQVSALNPKTGILNPQLCLKSNKAVADKIEQTEKKWHDLNDEIVNKPVVKLNQFN